MARKLLAGFASLILFGSFCGLSGAFASTQQAALQRSQIAAEVCSVCDANCYRIYELESEKCKRGKQYRTDFAVRLCRAAATENLGYCLKRCNHNK